MGVKQRATGRWQVDLASTYVGIYADERTARMMFAAGRRQVELGKPLAEVIRELRGENESPTLAEYARGWLPTCTTKEHAEALYRHKLAWQHMEPHIGKRTLDALTADDVKRLVDRLYESYSAKTVRMTVATLKMMLSDAQDAGLARRNVAAKVRNLPDAEESEQVAFSTATFRALVAASPHESAPLRAVAGYSGMRIGELLGLRHDRVSRAGILVEVQQRARDRKQAPTKRDRRGRSKTRLVPLTMDAWYWLAVQEQTSVRPDSPYVFPNLDGKPIPRTNMRRMFDKAAEEVGVRATPHMYRHSAGSWMLQSGVPDHVVAAWLGHTPEMLARTYAHELEEARPTNLARFQTWMNGDVTGPRG